MIDPDLLASIDESAATLGLHQLSRAESEQIANRIASEFNLNAAQTWWWQSSLGDHFPYSDYVAATDKIKMLMNSSDKEPCYLGITDDEPAPWPIIKGDLSSLLKIVEEQRVFEYFIADFRLTRIVFDTHMNELIFVERTPD